jgi:hypothetical protein
MYHQIGLYNPQALQENRPGALAQESERSLEWVKLRAPELHLDLEFEEGRQKEKTPESRYTGSSY